MKLSELYELSPLGWEEAKREIIWRFGVGHWEWCVKRDLHLFSCLTFDQGENCLMWAKLEYDNDLTLLKEWEAKQIK